MSKKTCFVPLCRSGLSKPRDEAHISLYSFPLKEPARLKLWVSNIRREDREPGKHDTVCSLHFEACFFKRPYISAENNDGKQQRATLTKNAVPTIFSDYPSYLSKLPIPRRSPDTRRKEAEYRQFRDIEEEEARQFAEEGFQDVGTFLDLLRDRLPLAGLRVQWNISHSIKDERHTDKTTILLYALDRNHDLLQSFPKVFASVELRPTFDPVVFVKGRDMSRHDWANREVETYSDVLNILNEIEAYSSEKTPQLDSAFYLEKAHDCIQLAIAHHVDSDEDEDETPSHLTYAVRSNTMEDESGSGSELDDGVEADMQPAEFRIPSQTQETPSEPLIEGPERGLGQTYANNRRAVTAESVKRRKRRRRHAVPQCDPATMRYLAEQLRHLTTHPNGRRFSPHMMAYAAALMYKGESVYRLVQRSHSNILPSVRNLQKYCTEFRCKEGLNDDQLNLIRSKVAPLNDRERHCILLTDEISTRSEVRYAGHQLSGVSKNPTDNTPVISSVCAFMVVSVGGSFKEVVALYPTATDLKGNELAEKTRRVIEELESIGVKVVAVGADNHQKNATMFTELAEQSGQVKDSVEIPNPADPSRTIVLMNDPVHLIKSWMNNWLNVPAQQFLYPEFPSSSAPLDQRAQFTHLKKVYDQDKLTMLKSSRLTRKSVRPQPIERQNVKRALVNFDSSTIASLKLYASQDPNAYAGFEQTATMLDIMSKWWSIMNIHSMSEGRRFRNGSSLPFTRVDDERLTWLDQFVLWASNWSAACKAMTDKNTRSPGLTTTTFKALIRTTRGVVLLIRSLLTSGAFDYVLTGKFQSDPIEARFGCYRNRAGYQPLITTGDVFYAQSRIQMNQHLMGHKCTFGTVELFKSKKVNAKPSPAQLAEDFETLLETAAIVPLELNLADESVLVHRAGYVVHKVVVFNGCKHGLLLNKQDLAALPASYDFLLAMDRGGLKIPSKEALELVRVAYTMFSLLVQDNNRKQFLEYHGTDQKFLLQQLSITAARMSMPHLSPNCTVCQVPLDKVLAKMMSVCANLFLSGYSRHVTNLSEDANEMKRLAKKARKNSSADGGKTKKARQDKTVKLSK